MAELIADMGCFVVSSKPDVLVCLALGSCIGLSVYDKEISIGGMAHIMLPSSEGVDLEKVSSKNKYADIAIKNMVDELKSKGVKFERAVIRIAGGAHMFKGLGSTMEDIGSKNVQSVKKIIGEMNLRISAEETGGSVGRTVRLFLEDGRFEIKTKDGAKEI